MPMAPLQFSGLKLDDLKKEGLPRLNDMFRQIIDAINDRQGVHGPVAFSADIDMQGNRIKNLGTAVDAADALSTTAANPIYGAPAQQATMEAVGKNILQTTRRLNDSTQRHDISTDLKNQGSIPPTVVGTISYTSTANSITWAWTNLIIQYGDGSEQDIPDSSLLITGLGGAYKFYPYLDTAQNVVNFVADPVNGHGSPPVAFIGLSTSASIAQNLDGRIPLSIGAINGQTGGGGGTGGGNNCKHASMLVESKIRGVIPIISVNIGEEIKARVGWTEVTRKLLGTENNFIKIVCSNGEVLLVTPSDPLPTWEGGEIFAQDVSLSRLLVGIDESEKEYPLQIVELAPIPIRGTTVLLTCRPSCEFLVGSHLPSVVGHNFMPNK